MNFKNVTAGLCAAVMVLTMLPVMPIEVQAAEAPTGKVYASHVDSSKFPHATGSPMDAQLFGEKCYALTGKITFSKEAYPGAGGVALNGDSTVYAVISGQNATIYSKEGGGVFAPIDSTNLFNNYWDKGIKAAAYDFSGLDTSKVTNMGKMFYGSDATSLDLSNFDTSKVTSMRYMFCMSKATNLDLTNFDTNKVTDMSYMFEDSDAIILNVSNFDTSKVTDMTGMFKLTKASRLDLSSFDTSGGTNISYMFYGSKATSVLCRTEEEMNKMMNSDNCEATGFRVASSKPVSEMDKQTFWNVCGKLTGKITFSKEAYPGTGGVALNYWDDTVFAVISGQDATIYSRDGGGVFAPADSYSLFRGSDAAGQFVRATAYDFSGLNTSLVTNMEYMFRDSYATSLNLSSFDTSKVTNMRYMFYKSPATSLDLSNFDTSNVTNMSGMFSNSAATSLDLSNFDTSKAVGYTSSMFYKSKATSVLCRTEEDMNRMKKSKNCAATGFHVVTVHNPDTHVVETNYVWTPDGKACTATHKCTTGGCSYAETSNGVIKSNISKNPTCTEKGQTTYTATFSNSWAKTQTKVVTDINATGHKMGVTSYNWSSDGKQCTAIRKCSNAGCEYTESFKGTMKSSVVKQPTCTDKGQTKYDATFAVDWAVPQSKTMTDIATNEHTWQEEWSKDGVNHWHECSVCHTHKDETAHTWNAGEITKPATYKEAGVKTYTCTACGQQKTETIPMMQHELGDVTYNWASDGKSCTAVKKCIHEGCDYSEQAVANISSEVNKAATCGAAGDTKYTATFVESWASEQTKIVVGDIPANGNHVYDNESDMECNECGHIREQETNTIPINEITFPDANFRNWVLTNVDGKNGAAVTRMARFMSVNTKDGQLDNTEQQTTGSIDVHAQGIKDLRGIEYFPNLRVLDCSDNQLEDLNLSNNEKLESVDASNNPGLNKVEINNKLDGILHPTVDENVEVDFVDPHITKHSGEGNNIPVTLKTVAHTFSVTVPTSLPISVAADGVITCADAAACKVVNNEEGPVDIKSIVLTGDNSWTIVPTTTAMESEAVNTKKLAMTVMGYETNDGGLNTASFVEQTINGNADFGIVYTAKLPTQTVETDKAPVANVVFTIGWHEAA